MLLVFRRVLWVVKLLPSPPPGWMFPQSQTSADSNNQSNNEAISRIVPPSEPGSGRPDEWRLLRAVNYTHTTKSVYCVRAVCGCVQALCRRCSRQCAAQKKEEASPPVTWSLLCSSSDVPIQPRPPNCRHNISTEPSHTSSLSLKVTFHLGAEGSREGVNSEEEAEIHQLIPVRC